MNDCESGEDENQCGYTTFEDDMSGWVDKSDGIYTWVRSRGGNPETNTGPSAGINLNGIQNKHAFLLTFEIKLYHLPF